MRRNKPRNKEKEKKEKYILRNVDSPGGRGRRGRVSERWV